MSRQYTYPLRFGHKVAYLCTESTMYNYVDNLEAPKKWFRANVDRILKVYGKTHSLQKEDLYLGTVSLQQSMMLAILTSYLSSWNVGHA